jgi:hypothetical protein
VGTPVGIMLIPQTPTISQKKIEVEMVLNA